MANVVIHFLTILSLLFTSATQDIEQAFLQGNPKILYPLFSSQNSISISFPQPISFSDQVSNQQAYFLIRRLLKTYSTFEFFSDTSLVWTTNSSFIFKARWSFKDKKNNRFVYTVFFYFLKEQTETRKGTAIEWKLTEIKAEIGND